MGRTQKMQGNDTYHPMDETIMNRYNETRDQKDETCFCYAPFRSIFFSFLGDVYACCENLSYKYGVFPDQSVREIWFGDRVARMREHLRRNDLELGCRTCKDYLQRGSFYNIKARYYDFAPAADTYPSRMEFQLTNTCNLACVMCDGWSSSVIRKKRDRLGPLKDPYDDSFVDQLEEFLPHLRQAHFVGGEPFVIDVYYKIWDRLVDRNPSCQITVQTNATVLNAKVKRLLERGKFSINVSLDSLKKKTYEEIRKGAKLEKTMGNIEYLISYCRREKTTFQFTPCPMTINWMELPGLVRYANKKKVVVVFHTVLYPRKYSLFRYDERTLWFIYLFLRLSLMVMPAFTKNEKLNRYFYRALLNQVRHFYTDAEKRDEWQRFEQEQKKEIEKQRRKEMNPD